jgi:hypothetical protein
MANRIGYDPYTFVVGSGLTDLIDETDNQIDGFAIGSSYRFTAHGAGCVVRWGTSEAVATNGNFDFAVSQNEVIEVVAQATSASIKEMSTASPATARLFVSKVAVR